MALRWTISSDYPMRCWAELASNSLEEYADWLAVKPLHFDQNVRILIPNADESLVRKLDSIEGCPMPIVSKKLGESMRKFAHADIQVFDLDIEAANGNVSGYQGINIIRKVSCLDVKKSDVKFMTDGKTIANVKKFYLNTGCLGLHHLVREANFEPMIIVSDSLASEISRLSPVGMSLRPEGVEGW